MTEGKVWGATRKIVANALFEKHRLEIKAGGYCSKHHHKTKVNGFYVESGTLIIRVWRGSYPDETVLKAGMWTQVEPGVPHQFEALENTVAFELYWSQYEANDIERDTVGGMRGQAV